MVPLEQRRASSIASGNAMRRNTTDVRMMNPMVTEIEQQHKFQTAFVLMLWNENRCDGHETTVTEIEHYIQYRPDVILGTGLMSSTDLVLTISRKGKNRGKRFLLPLPHFSPGFFPPRNRQNEIWGRD